jgi:hypothetical protein
MRINSMHCTCAANSAARNCRATHHIHPANKTSTRLSLTTPPTADNTTQHTRPRAQHHTTRAQHQEPQPSNTNTAHPSPKPMLCRLFRLHCSHLSFFQCSFTLTNQARRSRKRSKQPIWRIGHIFGSSEWQAAFEHAGRPPDQSSSSGAGSSVANPMSIKKFRSVSRKAL